MSLLDALNPLLSISKGALSGLLGPITDTITSIVNKRQDSQLEGFKTASGIDLAAYQAHLDAQVKLEELKVTANTGWGWASKLLYLMVGVPMCAHCGLIALDSTIPFGTLLPMVGGSCPGGDRVYGCLGIPTLPGIYSTYEGWVIGSLFVVTALNVLPNKVSQWFSKK